MNSPTDRWWLLPAVREPCIVSRETFPGPSWSGSGISLDDGRSRACLLSRGVEDLYPGARTISTEPKVGSSAEAVHALGSTHRTAARDVSRETGALALGVHEPLCFIRTRRVCRTNQANRNNRTHHVSKCRCLVDTPAGFSPALRELSARSLGSAPLLHPSWMFHVKPPSGSAPTPSFRIAEAPSWNPLGGEGEDSGVPPPRFVVVI